MAEGNPRATTSLLARFLAAIVRAAVWSPRLSIAIALLGIGISLYLSSTRLGYRTSRAALVDQRQEYHQHWLKYVEEFGDREDVVVVVQGSSGEAIIPAIDTVVDSLSRCPESFQAVLHKIDLTKLREKGLYYLKTDELRTIDGFLNDVDPIIRGGWELLSPGTMAAGMCAQLQMQQSQPQQLQQSMAAAQVKVAQIAESLLTALSVPGAYKSPWPELSGGSVTPLMGLTSHRLLIGDDRIGMVLLKLVPDTGKSFIQNTESIAKLRSVIDEVKRQYPDVTIGLTGLPIMEHDEMQRSQASMSVATVLSFVFVFLVLVVGFGGLRHSAMAIATLLVGLIWSLGYTTAVVGHLNILSSCFGAVLTGLGINYSIYFTASYLQLRQSRCTVGESLTQTATGVGPGIAISAMSSAVGFYAAGLTEFKGVAELGFIAGGGIMLCLTAAMTVLPAILKLTDSNTILRHMPAPLDFQVWLKPFLACPRMVLFASLVGTVAVAMGMTRLHYDYNLLHLEPEGLESVELEQKLLAASKESVYFALSMAKSPQEAAARKEAFLKLPTVERVDEIATRFPAGLEEKRPLIARIHDRLAGLPERPPQIPVASPMELGQMLSAVGPLMAANSQMASFQRQLQEIGSLLGRLPPKEYYARLSEYQQHVAADLLGRLHLLRSVASPQPPQPTDLPVGLISRFVGRNGSHLLRIYVKGDFWDIDNMRQFVSQVRSVDEAATGNPIQIFYASEQMRKSYENAALYALLAILPVVFTNFGSLRATLLSALPLVMGMLQMFGLMGLLDIPLNSANMIGLSLMLGMGMENGVLITFDYVNQRGRYRMSSATGVAVVLNTLTTMVGFAVLIIADHRGLQSLGRMLTIGMSCVLFSSLVCLPVLLTLISRNRAGTEAAPPEEMLPRPTRTGVGWDRPMRRPESFEPSYSSDESPLARLRRTSNNPAINP